MRMPARITAFCFLLSLAAVLLGAPTKRKPYQFSLCVKLDVKDAPPGKLTTFFEGSVGESAWVLSDPNIRVRLSSACQASPLPGEVQVAATLELVSTGSGAWNVSLAFAGVGADKLGPELIKEQAGSLSYEFVIQAARGKVDGLMKAQQSAVYREFVRNWKSKLTVTTECPAGVAPGTVCAELPLPYSTYYILATNNFKLSVAVSSSREKKPFTANAPDGCDQNENLYLVYNGTLTDPALLPKPRYEFLESDVDLTSGSDGKQCANSLVKQHPLSEQPSSTKGKP
jgi:hypothetical protein